MQQSSSERESVGSHDTGIDLNPDDVPAGYHPSVDRRLAHRRRSRSLAPSHAAAADNVPRVIDADDETDDPSVGGGKDAAAPGSRLSSTHSASFDRTVEWLLTRTGSKCPSDQLSGAHVALSLSCSNAPVCDAESCETTAAAADTKLQASVDHDMTALPEVRNSRSLSRSPSQSLCKQQSNSDADDNELRLAASSDSLSIGLRRRVVDGSVSATEHVVSSDVADRRHQLPTSRRTPMSCVAPETDIRNRRRSKQKVPIHSFFPVSTMEFILFVNLMEYNACHLNCSYLLL